jgi:hypothetical protein
MISREVKPQEPRIKGVPSKMAIFNRAESGDDWGVYIGGSSLHRYAQAGDGSGAAVWDEGDLPQPPGKIYDLAAAGNYLYALAGQDPLGLYRLGKGSGAQWEEVGFAAGDAGFSQFQAIYGEVNGEGLPVGDILFVGTSNGSPGRNGDDNFAIFYTDGVSSEGKLNLAVQGTGLLTGAAQSGNFHYVSTNGTGIYAGASPAALNQIPPGDESLRVNGLINIESAVLALCYEGDILRVNGSALSKLNSNSIRFNFRGPAALWRPGPGGAPALLLTAVRNSDPVYGYREILLSGNPPELAGGELELRHPGDDSPTTVGDDKQFKDTIEPKPLNAILQVPARIDPEMVLLVSVQGTGTMNNDTDGGLWSYRSRDGIWQWNAEN